MHPPGLDGSGLTAFVQYPTLAQAFELRCLTMPTSDRSSFIELVELVRAELRVCAMSNLSLCVSRGLWRVRAHAKVVR